jgi:hypothetical protein
MSLAIRKLTTLRMSNIPAQIKRILCSRFFLLLSAFHSLNFASSIPGTAPQPAPK